MQYAGLGITLGVVVGLFAYGGYALDTWLDTQPVFFLVGILVGAAGGMLHVVRSVDALVKKDRRDDGS